MKFKSGDIVIAAGVIRYIARRIRDDEDLTCGYYTLSFAGNTYRYLGVYSVEHFDNNHELYTDILREEVINYPLPIGIFSEKV